MARRTLPASTAWLFPEYEFGKMNPRAHPPFVCLVATGVGHQTFPCSRLGARRQDESMVKMAYFDDAAQQPMPDMLRRIRWADAKSYAQEGAKYIVQQQRRKAPSV
jgi:hypothetical protein